jgi:hypothetical protein
MLSRFDVEHDSQPRVHGVSQDSHPMSPGLFGYLFMSTKPSMSCPETTTSRRICVISVGCTLDERDVADKPGLPGRCIYVGV